MTKRFAGLAVAAATAGSLLLPAAPAQAYCISLITTPVDCVKELLVSSHPLPNGCFYLGTFEIVCLPAAS